MTNEQLDGIEAALRLKLPDEYRQVSVEFPFRPIGRDWVYWFYDDPQAVIGETRAPLAYGDYDRHGWRDSFVVIGQSAAGDLYLLDTAAAGSTVFCLSHETHAIEVEWTTFDGFVQDWLHAPEDAARRQAAATQPGEIGWHRWRLIMALVFLFGVVLPLLAYWLLP